MRIREKEGTITDSRIIFALPTRGTSDRGSPGAGSRLPDSLGYEVATLRLRETHRLRP